MMKLRTAVVAVLVAVPVVGMTAAPAHACMGEVCDAINYVCAKVLKGGQCVG